jgi:uncharacterized protein
VPGSVQGKNMKEAKPKNKQVSTELKKLKPKIVGVLKKNGIKKAGIFGSYARGEQGKKSDIDIVIQPTKDMGFAFFGLALELEEKTGKRVDLVTYKSLHPMIKEQILEQEMRIL